MDAILDFERAGRVGVGGARNGRARGEKGVDARTRDLDAIDWSVCGHRGRGWGVLEIQIGLVWKRTRAALGRDGGGTGTRGE